MKIRAAGRSTLKPFSLRHDAHSSRRVVWTGNEPGKSVASHPQRDMNLMKLSTEELAALLAHKNHCQRRMAQHFIAERRDPLLPRKFHYRKSKIHELAMKGETSEVRLSAIWTLHSAGALEVCSSSAASTINPTAKSSFRRFPYETQST